MIAMSDGIVITSSEQDKIDCFIEYMDDIEFAYLMSEYWLDQKREVSLWLMDNREEEIF